ncbi:hypothetical protein EVAR_22086_1 [Eumeta japonica]|uniref:Uncharacterized protein n=1 Tax=Eumeta variegata TaxID=151549 RepID=A0A4C1UUI7_EUMVA|nr:hypothetical protein EVAR_22086_1 [Eumeta japonica]
MLHNTQNDKLSLTVHTRNRTLHRKRQGRIFLKAHPRITIRTPAGRHGGMSHSGDRVAGRLVDFYCGEVGTFAEHSRRIYAAKGSVYSAGVQPQNDGTGRARSTSRTGQESTRKYV